MVDAAATLASSAGVYAMNAPQPLRRLGTQNNWYVPASNFRASDGEWVQVIAFGEPHWRGLCRALGHEQWLSDPRCADNDARVAHRELVHGWIAAAIATAPAAAWESSIVSAGGFCQRIREIEEAWADPLLAERGLVGSVGPARPAGSAPFPVPIASLARASLPAVLPSGPALGEHTDALAAELGVPSSA
jgi:crotonobetainyl-CoA:carnitine CoA-transferase CaiB-like acyl-CoA transferase